MTFEILSVLIGIIGTALATVGTLIVKQKADKAINQGDETEARVEVSAFRGRLEEGTNDVVSLMMNNVSELREYYVISKRQANRAFSATLTICVLGFVVFVSGIAANVFAKQNVLLYTTLSGAIIEVISGLFFWLYKKTIAQLNLYHERLGATEKYLVSMQLAEKMSAEKKDETYRYLIESIMIDNSSMIRKPFQKPTDAGAQ